MKFFLNLKAKKLLIILILMLLIILHKIIFNSKNIKVCLCVLAKLENKYIIQYIEHYKKIGVDKMFIYDNNDLNGEKFDFVLLEYIKKKYVEVINFRGKISPQIKMLNDCYKKNNKNYDWFILFDSDEYIELKYFNNIKLFLNQKKFNKCDIIYFRRAFQIDANKIKYENKSLSERFTTSVYPVLTYKPILKGNISNLHIHGVHRINSKLKFCNSFGKSKDKTPDFKVNFIKHYCFKSTEEFIEKINRGDGVFNNTEGLKLNKIYFYFKYNKMTLEKINYIENKTGISLLSLKKKLK